MNITKKEFKLLFKIKRNGYIMLQNDDNLTMLLLNKGLIDYADFGLTAKKSEKFVLTNEGEYYLEQNVYMQASNFRSWAAMIISVIALIISTLNFLLTYML
ncbi:MAG: hypothetical protein NC452_18920 [Eubacterium sp.]|nr:hypothetical protein [Eubacterium sp.]